MDIYRYTAETHMGPNTESHQFTVDSLKYASPLHTHDFFEFFLVTSGNAWHIVNNTKYPLVEGSLVFIRPDDIHGYDYKGDQDCSFVNVCYTKEAVNRIFSFLGEEFSADNLITSELPPMALLPPSMKQQLADRLEKIVLHSSRNKRIMSIQHRSVLADLLVQWFWQFPVNNDKTVPLWLEALLMQMQRREHYTAGLSRLYELSQRSPGHLNRVFRQYLGITPVQYINQLRLNEAKYLLISTKLSVIDIAMATGFNNLSHFYHLFKREFHTAPAEFRKRDRKDDR